MGQECGCSDYEAPVEPAREQLFHVAPLAPLGSKGLGMAWEILASGQVPSKERETELLGEKDGAGGGNQRPGRWSVLMTEL